MKKEEEPSTTMIFDGPLVIPKQVIKFRWPKLTYEEIKATKGKTYKLIDILQAKYRDEYEDNRSFIASLVNKEFMDYQRISMGHAEGTSDEADNYVLMIRAHKKTCTPLQGIHDVLAILNSCGWSVEHLIFSLKRLLEE